MTISFVSDASYNEGNGGSNAGNGNYHLLSSSAGGVDNVATRGQQLFYDLDGQIRNNSGWGSSGAYEQAIVLTQVFGW
jgi:hypothetical protein